MIRANGVQLCYESLGDPAAPPIVLVQGLGAQMLGWHPEFCSRLTDAGFQVVRFDNRDAGQSEKFPAQPYSLTDMAADTAGLIEALELGPVHLVGQSMGGMIAQQVVIDFPHLVDTLGLIYTAPNNQYFVGLDLVETRMDVSAPRNRIEAAAMYVICEKPCASPDYPTDTAWLRELGASMYDRESTRDGETRQFAAIHASPDRSSRLGEIAVPTTIMCGSGDRLIDPAASSALHQAIPESQLTVFEGMGHELPGPLWDSIARVLVDNTTRSSISRGVDV